MCFALITSGLCGADGWTGADRNGQVWTQGGHQKAHHRILLCCPVVAFWAGLNFFQLFSCITQRVGYSGDMSNTMSPETQIEKLTAAGYTAKLWERDDIIRVYVREKGRDIGYLIPTDTGGTGSCKHITRRAGSVAAALRG